MCVTDYGEWFSKDFVPVLIESVDHLQNVTQDARVAKRSIRVIGAGRGGGWVQFAPSYDPNVIWISLDGMSGRFRGFNLVQDGDLLPRVVAGAAIYLGANPERNATWNDSLVAQLSQHSLALPNLVGSLFQQLGSVVLTNSEGGSSRYSMSDAVIGLRFVNGLGELAEVWRGDDDFGHAMVSLGLAGVLYEVVLQPEAQYCVRADIVRSIYVKESNAIETLAFLRKHDYARVLLRKQPSRYMQIRTAFNRIETCADVPLDRRPDETFTWTGSPFMKHVLQQWMSFTAQPTCYAAYPGKAVCWTEPAQKALAPDILASSTRSERLSMQLCLREQSKETRNQEELRMIGPRHETQLACTGSLNMDLDGDESRPRALQGSVWPATNGLPLDYRTSYLYNVEYSEIYFPEQQNDLSAVLDALFAFLETEVGFWFTQEMLEIYMSAPIDAPLSPSYNDTCMRIGMFMTWLNTDAERNKMVLDLSEFFAKRGFVFRLNWGKNLPTSDLDSVGALAVMRRVREAYPRLDEFRAFLDREDPDQLFRSRYWSRALWE